MRLTTLLSIGSILAAAATAWGADQVRARPTEYEILRQISREAFSRS